MEYGCISVLMSVYNGASTLEKAMDSILQQTYRNLEVIVCDDASTDRTWEILQAYQRSDSRVVCFQNKQNVGLGESLNRCYSRSKGAYIARQDADDISDLDRLEKTLTYLLNSKVPYAACGVRVFDDNGVWNYRQHPEFITKHIIAQKNPFFHPTMLFRREVFQKAGGYRVAKETRRTEDYDLVMRLAAQGITGQNLQEILYSVYEPFDAYLRHTKKTRFYEIKVRLYGLKAMRAPLRDYIYLLKPVVMSIVPRCCIKVIKQRQWGVANQG